jgi:hypothetical protein
MDKGRFALIAVLVLFVGCVQPNVPEVFNMANNTLLGKTVTGNFEISSNGYITSEWELSRITDGNLSNYYYSFAYKSSGSTITYKATYRIKAGGEWMDALYVKWLCQSTDTSFNISGLQYTINIYSDIGALLKTYSGTTGKYTETKSFTVGFAPDYVEVIVTGTNSQSVGGMIYEVYSSGDSNLITSSERFWDGKNKWAKLRSVAETARRFFDGSAIRYESYGTETKYGPMKEATKAGSIFIYHTKVTNNV